MSVLPHGGRLINRYADPSRIDELLNKCGRLKTWLPNERELADLEMIASGAYSPLAGFMNRGDFRAVLDSMRLSKGPVWPLPITLTASQSFGASLKPGEEIALLDETRRPIAIMTVSDVFDYNPMEYGHKVYKTTDQTHPGVAALYASGPKMIGGEVALLRRREHKFFTRYRLDPPETRELFENRKWKTIAGFQTRSPIHRDHEYLQKCALEIVDGLFLHPAPGDAGDEIPPDVRFRCYEALMDDYYPKDKVVLAVNPAVFRHAGPREALFHALVLKNYGCTHFIVGRDQAGFGNTCGPFEAAEIFEQFDPKDLGITPFFFENAFFCKACGGMATPKTCSHTEVARLMFTPAAVREMLQKGRPLPQEFTRAEIGVILMEAFRERMKERG
jgi:sulfate adenylyltransferase